MNSFNKGNTARGPKLMPDELRKFLFDQNFDPTRPIILFNEETVQQYWYAIPADLLEAANESAESIQRAIAPANRPAVIGLSKEHHAQFVSGKPVLTYYDEHAHPEKRTSGGQVTGALEDATRRGLAATVFSAAERIRHLQAIRDKKKHTTKGSSLYQAVTELIQCWPEDDGLRSAEDPNAAVEMTADYEKGPRRKHIDTLYEKGRHQSCWKEVYVSSNLKKDIKAWSARFIGSDESVINQEIAFQKAQVLALLHCETRAATLRMTLGDISDQVANGDEESRSQLWALAGVAPGHRRLFADVVAAAFATDINPSNLFTNLKNARPYFETMRLLGRLYRRHPQSEFTHEDIGIIRKTLPILEQWTREPWTENDASSRWQAFWAQAMSKVMTLAGWHQYFDESIEREKK